MTRELCEKEIIRQINEMKKLDTFLPAADSFKLKDIVHAVWEQMGDSTRI